MELGVSFHSVQSADLLFHKVSSVSLSGGWGREKPTENRYLLVRLLSTRVYSLTDSHQSLSNTHIPFFYETLSGKHWLAGKVSADAKLAFS